MKRNIILGILVIPHLLFGLRIFFPSQALTASVLTPGHYEHWGEAVFAWAFFLSVIYFIFWFGWFAMCKRSLLLAGLASFMALMLYGASIIIFILMGMPSTWGD